MSFDEIWKVLEGSTEKRTSGFSVRRIRPEAACSIRLGVEKPSNNRHLLIRVLTNSLKTPDDFPKSKGFEVRQYFLPGDGKSYTTLSLRLTQKSFSDVFTSLVEDIVAHIAIAPNDTAAIEAMIERLGRWQAFLKKNSVEGLSEEAQIGLYGELYFLCQFAIPSVGIRRSIQAWTGPTGTNQDFEFGPLAIEVKTSSSKLHQKLLVSSERQLDDKGLVTLLIFHLSLDKRKGKEDTLLEIVNRTRSLLIEDTVATHGFENALFQTGYLDCHSKIYDRIGYTVRERNFFRVGPGFPRIVEGMVPVGVGDIRYSISVAECKKYLMAEKEAIQRLKGRYDEQ